MTQSKIICLDWGTLRWGLASVDLRFGICLPRETLSGNNKYEVFLKILGEESCTHVVIGYPYNLNGTPGKNCPAIDRVKKALEKEGIKVTLWDERLSSETAAKSLIDQGITRKKKDEMMDSQAALVILEEYLKSIPRGRQ